MVIREGNRIQFLGGFLAGDLRKPLAGLHQAVEHAGYQDLVLDFGACTAAFAGPMLALCAQVMKLRSAGVAVEVVFPSDPKLFRLFHNANWAHLLQPDDNASSTFRGHTQIAATQFHDAEEQAKAVNLIVGAILGAIPRIERADFAALEWSVNEITDNVLVHSRSDVGGIVQVSTFQRNRKTVEYIVADAGVGIASTLREGHPELDTDALALDRCIREGVTRDKSVGQGNGLFGSFQICCQSGGEFQVESGWASLSFRPRSGLHIKPETIPVNGTLVLAQIDFSSPQLLQEALRIGGNVFAPVDFVETRYEDIDGERIVIVLKDESNSFGSRAAGVPVRIRIANLVHMCPGQRIHVDFDGVPLVSSSFADEVFGKLFIELGAIAFGQLLDFHNVPTTVRQLIDRAIAQRIVAGVAD